MEAVRIDISKYEQVGEGANGYSYNNPDDPNEMLKIYNKGYDTAMIEVELDVARKVYEIGVPTPQPGELVTDGDRIGIRFRRIPNKVSFARAIADNPDLLKPLAEEFAGMCRELHSKKCDYSVFGDAKDQFLKLLDADTAFDAEQKAKIAAVIKNSPDTGTLLHGDMHFGNAIISGPVMPQEGQKRDLLWIDLGYFSTGYYMFDLGMLYDCCYASDEQFILENFHFPKSVAKLFFDTFVPAYFQNDDAEFLAAKLEEIKCYAAIKALLIEYNCGNVLFDNFKQVFMESILK